MKNSDVMSNHAGFGDALSLLLDKYPVFMVGPYYRFKEMRGYKADS